VGEWSAARPGRTLPLGKTRYPLYRRLGGPQGRSGRRENLIPTGNRSRTVQLVAQSLYRRSYRAHICKYTNGVVYTLYGSRDYSVGIATELPGWTFPRSNPGGGEIFRTCPDRPWGPPSLLYNGYRIFPGVKQPARDVEHPPHLAPRLKREHSYTSTTPLGLRGLF